MMGFDAYLKDDEGNLVAPPPDGNWDAWVSAGKTRNYCNGDTLCDWLDLYGEAKGFTRDDRLPGWEKYLDFTEFIFDQGHRFEAEVLKLLDARFGLFRVEIAGMEPWEQIRSLEGARQTFEAMRRAEPIISQGVLWNPETCTYGAADLLIRSDILRELFPSAISEEEVNLGAPGIGLIRWHYRVIDIKFKTLPLNKDGQAAAELKDYMVQVHIYNRALGRIQGITPGAAYLLGRGWKHNGDRGNSCFDRLAICREDRDINGTAIAQLGTDAVAWIRRLRAEGSAWDVLPMPSVYELWPNSEQNGWSTVCKQVRQQTEDVACLWQVGKARRPKAHENGITSWKDPRFTPEAVGISGEMAGVLAALRDVNLALEGDPLRPAVIRTATDEWAAPASVEFYVDFEWTGDTNDDFSQMPRKGGDDVIFMIGCGHLEAGEWKFASFVSDDLSDEAEGRIVDQWLAHMDVVTSRLGPGTNPKIFHWSPAEESAFETQWNSARRRHPEKDWPQPNWYDFLNKVMKREPIVVRGAMAFGLKAVARAMHRHGLIETLWGDSKVGDGLNAMVAAWRCAEQAKERGCTISAIPLMAEIRQYNEVDCRVMMEIIRVLRSRAAARESRLV
jgi:hypothetical protein